MSFLRALRAYIGLGPDEDIEDRYLYELNSRRRELDLDELEAEEQLFDDESGEFDLDADDVVIVTPGGGRKNVTRPGRFDQTRRDASNSDGPIDHDADRRSSARNGRSFGEEPSGRNERSGRGPRSQRDRLAASDFIDDFDLDEELSLVDRGGEVIDLDTAAERDVIDGTGGSDDEGILDFLADENFLDDSASVEPGRASSGGRGGRRGATQADARTRPRAGHTERAADESFPKAVVRSLDSMRAKPRTLIPESFSDAKLVADEFKRDIPVLLNLQSLDRDLARRLIDFASGICYAMDGSMEKIASQVFLLIPESVEVSDEDRRRIEERGYAR